MLLVSNHEPSGALFEEKKRKSFPARVLLLASDNVKHAERSGVEV